MSIHARLARSFLVSLLFLSSTCFRQNALYAQSSDNKIYLDVVVTPKSGPPVAGLQRQDFTVMDNKALQPITSFHALGGSQAPIEVILVVDTVNASYQVVAYERGQIENFLRANGGRLAYPTALAVLADTGTKIQQTFSSDGNGLSSDLDAYVVGLRTIRRSNGFYGAADRFQLSLEALHSLVAREATRPGRKIILWVSPGWPLLSGPGMQLSFKQEQQLFDDVVGLSTLLRQARVTLYSIDPIGTADAGIRSFYYQAYVKGISKPSQAQAADLGLQVLATQSGGLALNSSNDLTGLLRKCLADTESYYELSFDSAPGERREEYHHLEIRLAKPGLTARTRDGYYSQP